MANYWLVSIGINQYRFLPPLSYAQRDAELLYEFLIQSAGFRAPHCDLLSDRITVVDSDPKFPTGQHIQTRFSQLQHQVKAGDVLLCLFSGYGVRLQGKDYLLPIEAEPKQVGTTGISVESWLQTLQSLPTKTIVLIDANRSQLGLQQEGFGQHTVQLAQELGIAALLSCQPDQFSHEPLTLRQGIFAAGLLAAFQAGCLTLEQLVEFLQQRLPALSEEFWRPRQDLLATVPAGLRYQLLLPDWIGAGAISSGAGRSALALIPAEPAAVLSRQLAFLSRTGSHLKQTVAGWLSLNHSPSSPAMSGASVAVAPDRFGDSAADSDGLSDEFFWRRLLVQSGLIAGILLFGVILRNSGALINSTDRSFERVLMPPPAPQVQSSASPVESAAPTPASEPIALDPALLMQAAQTAFQAKQYEDANRQLSQISAELRSPEQQQLLEQINRELLNKAKTMLIRNRQPAGQNQVSDLVEAIKVARLVKTDQPLYAEAQQNIDRWSRLVLDMAQGRAARSNDASVVDAANNYSMAISAAQLVPADQVKPYEQAQQAIALWSQKIFDLANTRAANGELDLAIQIGELVPPNTPVYATAQDSIANWRNQPAPKVETSQVEASAGATQANADTAVSNEP